MNELLEKINHLFSQLSEVFHRYLWPDLDHPPIGREVQERLRVLPPKTNEDFQRLLREELTILRHRRNLSVFLIGVALFQEWWLISAGCVLYWWYLKNQALPILASDVLERLIRRLDLHRTELRMPPAYGEELPPEPRPLLITYDAANLTPENLQPGYLFEFDLKTWQVVGRKQLDWLPDGSELMIQAISGGDSGLLFLRRGYPTLFARRLSVHLLNSGLEDQLARYDKPPATLQFQEQMFYREQPLNGYLFDLHGTEQCLHFRSWDYCDLKREQWLRIMICAQKEIKVFTGRTISPYEISDILPAAGGEEKNAKSS